MDASRLGKAIFGKRALPSNPDLWELFEGAWIKTPPDVPPGLSLAEGFSDQFSKVWTALVCRKRTLRFCPKCLGEGFHSLLYQIEAITHCPRHALPFQLACPSCRGQIPLVLSKSTFARAFCCPACQQPLAGCLNPVLWEATPERKAEIENALSPLAQWLKELDAFGVSGERCPLAQLTLAGAFLGEPDTVVGFTVAQHFVKVNLPEGTWRHCGRPLQIQEITEVPCVEKKSHHDVCMLEGERFSSLEIKLEASALKGHTGCLERARHGVLLRPDMNQEVTQQACGLCPVAAGYLRWKYRCSLQQERRRKLMLNAYERSSTGPTELYTQRLLAQFYSCVATAYVCELMHRSGHELASSLNSPFSDLLHRYSTGLTDRDAYWEVGKTDSQSADRRMVAGSSELLGWMDSLHVESLFAHQDAFDGRHGPEVSLPG